MGSHDEITYQLYVDGQKTDVEVIGENKTQAYEMLEEQWHLSYPDIPTPKRRHCKLVYFERVMWG